MLIIWTTAKTGRVREAIGSVIKQHHGLPHKIISDFTKLPDSEPGDIIIACGTKAVEVLSSFQICPKNRTVTSMRGKPLTNNGRTFLCTFDANILDKEPALVDSINWDAQLAIRLLKTGQMEPILGKYTWVDDFLDVILYVEQQYAKTRKPVPVALDLETMGLDYMNSSKRIVSIAFTARPKTSQLLYLDLSGKPSPEVLRQIEWLITSPLVTLRGANLKYDSLWIQSKWGIRIENFWFDTTLVGSLLNENRSNSLNNHTKIYVTELGGYDDAFSLKYDKAHMELVPKDDLLTYAGGDTDACLRVSEALREELVEDPKLANFYQKCLHPAARAFEDLELEGVLADYDYYMHPEIVYKKNENGHIKYDKNGLPDIEKGLDKLLDKTIQDLTDTLLGLIPAKIRYKYADKLKLGTKGVLQDYFFSPLGFNLKPLILTDKTKQPSTAMKHLLQFDEVPEVKNFVTILKRLNSATKTKTTYITGFFKFLREDGRFHGSYILHKGGVEGGDNDQEAGTDTGRSSCKDPALQTVPKHTIWAKKLRRGFIAPEDCIIVNIDYSQGELKIAACLANETTMIQAYLNGIDLHLVTGGRASGSTLEDLLAMKKYADENPDSDEAALFAEIRQKGKAGNFGFIYGMGPEGFMSYAKYNYGVIFSLQEAVDFRNGYFATYPRLLEWHKECKAIAKRDGQIRSPLGRLRHVPHIYSPDQGVRSLAERQSVNSPVQGTLSDMASMALGIFKEQYGRPANCRPFLMTHDANTFYMHKSEAGVWIPRVVDIMENLPLEENFGWRAQLKFTVDVETGLNMAELKKYPHKYNPPPQGIIL
jgi:DNA polymerase I-like protein with 3'-5' exonuclease and polymerase domains